MEKKWREVKNKHCSCTGQCKSSSYNCSRWPPTYTGL